MIVKISVHDRDMYAEMEYTTPMEDILVTPDPRYRPFMSGSYSFSDEKVAFRFLYFTFEPENISVEAKTKILQWLDGVNSKEWNSVAETNRLW